MNFALIIERVGVTGNVPNVKCTTEGKSGACFLAGHGSVRGSGVRCRGDGNSA